MNGDPFPGPDIRTGGHNVVLCVALRDIDDGQLVTTDDVLLPGLHRSFAMTYAFPNSGRARYWAARYKFRNRPNRAKRRVVYARFRR